MRVVFLYVFIASLLFCSCNKRQVYICTGPKAYAYHENPNCPSMKANCTGSIKEISISEAKSMDRRPCGKCVRKD